MKKVLVCCGSSMITSSMAINQLKDVFKQEGIDAQIGQCKFSEVPGQLTTFQPDLIVPTGALSEKDAGGVPVVRGTSFVTGVGVEDTIREVLEVLNN